MTLRETMDSSIKDAMRARDTNRLTTLRAIKSLILLEATSGNNNGHNKSNYRNNFNQNSSLVACVSSPQNWQ